MAETVPTVSGDLSKDSYQNSLPHPDSHSEDDQKKKTLSSVQAAMIRFGNRLVSLRVEMIAFIVAFSYTLPKVSSTTMIVDKVCLVHFGLPEYICSDLQNYSDYKSQVERLATNYQLGHSLIQTVPAVVLACFVGPWSDHYGRKFPVLLALVGMILNAAGSVVCALFMDSPVEYYFIPAVFYGLFGGPVALMAVVYSYVSDTTPLQNRTIKYAFLEIAAGLALPLGAMAGGWIYELLGYPAVFFFSGSGLFLSVVLVGFCLPETRGLDKDDPWSTKILSMFSCTSFKASFVAALKERPHKGRKQVLLLIASMGCVIVAIMSTGDINYLFVLHQFGWSNKVYSTITAIYSVFGLVLLVIVVPLMKKYKVGDPALGLLGTVTLFGKNLGTAISWNSGIYHLSNLFGLLSGCAPLAVRSRISKVVSSEDLGKVFSFVATFESLLPIFGTIMASQIFTACLKTFPGAPYLAMALLQLVPLGVFIWTSRLPKMSYEDIDHKADNVDSDTAV